MRYHVIGLPEGKMKVKKNVVSTAPTLMISWVGTKSLKMYLLCSEIQNIALFYTFANIYIGLNRLNDKPKKKKHQRPWKEKFDRNNTHNSVLLFLFHDISSMASFYKPVILSDKSTYVLTEWLTTNWSVIIKTRGNLKINWGSSPFHKKILREISERERTV